MADTTCLIVNADDFGQSSGVTRGVLEAHDRGIVTSASLMVRWPAAEKAAAAVSARPRLSLGLHVDLGEWRYQGTRWVPMYEVTDLEDVGAVRREVASQVERFRDLTGGDPTHLDSHQHVHRSEPVWSAMVEVCDELGVPLRHRPPGIRYVSDFYGQSGKGYPYPEAITAQALAAILQELPPGISELGCHPGYGADLDSVYRDEREQELHALCDPAIRLMAQTLGIDLRSFAGIGTVLPSR